MARQLSDRVKRRLLFDSEETNIDNSTNMLKEELENDAELLKKKYNFNFKSDTALPGDYTWTKSNDGRYDWIGVKSSPVEDDQNNEDPDQLAKDKIGTTDGIDSKEQEKEEKPVDSESIVDNMVSQTKS